MSWSWTAQSGNRKFIEVDTESPHAVKIAAKQHGLKLCEAIVIVRNPPRKLKPSADLQAGAADAYQEHNREVDQG